MQIGDVPTAIIQHASKKTIELAGKTTTTKKKPAGNKTSTIKDKKYKRRVHKQNSGRSKRDNLSRSNMQHTRNDGGLEECQLHTLTKLHRREGD